MEKLNTYIKEGLLKNVGAGLTKTIDSIKKWISENYSCEIEDVEVVIKNRKIIANTPFVLFRGNDEITNGEFEWGEVKQFICSGSSITSLEGAPRECDCFDCSNCRKLKSLEGAPDKVDTFLMTFCDSIKDLKGMSKEARRIDCNKCENLESIKGAPDKIVNFDCTNCKKLKSLKGAPKECEEFRCSGCDSLTSLDGLDKVQMLFCSSCDKLNMTKDEIKTKYKNIHSIIK